MKEGEMPMPIAHRGVTQYAPENTIEAFRAAIKIGINAIEIDIQKTKDDKVVVVHDHNFTRLTLGHPTLPCHKSVSQMTWDEVRNIELPYANHLLLEFPDGGYKDETLALNIYRLLGQQAGHYYEQESALDNRMAKVMLFADFIEWLKTTPDDFFAEIEFKSSSLIEECDKIVRASNIAHKCIFFSGVQSYIDEIQNFYKSTPKPEGLKLGANIRILSDEHKKLMDDMDLYEIALNDGNFSQETVNYLRERDIKVFSNLGDYPEHWKLICDLGVDAFKTNYPEQFLHWYNNSYTPKH